MSTHTPGPWAVHPVFRTVVVPLADLNKSLGGAVDPDVEAERFAKKIHRQEGTEHVEFARSRVLKDEAEANARLIAAAPELLAALKACARKVQALHLERPNDDETWALYSQAIAAISKAEAP